MHKAATAHPHAFFFLPLSSFVSCQLYYTLSFAVKMRLASIAVLVMSAMASPYPSSEDSIAQAQEACGDQQTVSCCQTSSGGGNNGGALSGSLGGGSLGECAKLDSGAGA